MVNRNSSTVIFEEGWFATVDLRYDNMTLNGEMLVDTLSIHVVCLCGFLLESLTVVRSVGECWL